MYKTNELYDLNYTIAKEFLSKYEYPWQALADIKEFIINLGKTLDKNEYSEVSENVWIHKSAKVYPSACIEAPTIIMENAEIRQCAFIRGSALVGKGSVVGNSCELKNVIIFDDVQVPHFNYIGDSILGHKAHFGAGSITSNFRADHGEITIHGEEDFKTGRNKIGAFVGDNTEVGCNTVLNPGTVVGKNCVIYPLSCVRGIIKENSIYKNADNIVIKQK